MQKITTFFMFNDQAEQAAKLYTSVFPKSKVLNTMKGPDGKVMGVEFELDGQRFNSYNSYDGGTYFSFSEGLSLFVSCKDQEEVDHYWNGFLGAGGAESQCGWLKDPFGVSWQIVPTRFMELLNDPDPERAGRATQAMLKMQKIDIATLEKAAAGTE